MAPADADLIEAIANRRRRYPVATGQPEEWTFDKVGSADSFVLPRRLGFVSLLHDGRLYSPVGP